MLHLQSWTYQMKQHPSEPRALRNTWCILESMLLHLRLSPGCYGSLMVRRPCQIGSGVTLHFRGSVLLGGVADRSSDTSGHLEPCPHWGPRMDLQKHEWNQGHPPSIMSSFGSHNHNLFSALPTSWRVNSVWVNNTGK